jgi:serine/threonine protein kinase
MSSAPRVLSDRYELGPLLGRGGVADVFRARDRKTGRDVAVKLLRTVSEVDRERFAGEAELLAILDHPHVVTVLDTGVEEDRPFLVLELVEGRPMDERLRDGSVDATWLAAVGAQVSSALAHAHARGVVHRDVKPSNVLLADDDRAMLSDFGIARRTGSEPMTLTGHTVGTAAYLAPEQVAGEAVSTPADVYSLGLVLLEALTGRREYDGPAVEAAFARLGRSPGVPASLPRGWHGLISKMTARLPAERPTAREVEARLSVLAGRSPRLIPASTDATAQLAVREVPVIRRRSTLLVGAGMVALLLASAVLLGAGASDLDAPSSRSSPAGRSTTVKDAARIKQTKPTATAESAAATAVGSAAQGNPSPAPVKVHPDRRTNGGSKGHRNPLKTKKSLGKRHRPSHGKKHRPSHAKKHHGKKR